EVTVYFQDRVIANTSAAELLKYFPAHDLLANLPTAAILSTATYRMAEQMEQQTAAILQVASLVAKSVPDAEKPKVKPLIQIAGINLKRTDEVCEALSDVCHVQRIDPAYLSPSCIREDAKFVLLWGNQLKNPDKN